MLGKYVEFYIVIPHSSQYISFSISIQCIVYIEFGEVLSVGYKPRKY